jgi:hypothetical protein
MMHDARSPIAAALLSGMLWAVTAVAQPPAPRADVLAVPMPLPEATPQRTAIPPRNTGPAARSHSRYRRGRHGTSRIIRRTPEVMREDAARVKRGDLFSTWSNEYLE